MRGSQEGGERIATADLDRHNRSKFLTNELFHQADRAGKRFRINKPLLPDKRRAHLRYNCHQIVVPKVFWLDEPTPFALFVEVLEIELR
jgi:hypothetical protein